MKTVKLIALLLAALLLLAGCGQGTLPGLGETEEPASTAADTTEQTGEEKKISVWSPMAEAPLYELSADASPEEIRAMAVKAMRDELSVQWCVSKSFSYANKNGQEMPVNAGEVYCDLPYTQSATGLFQWLQYYDTATGKMADGVRGDLQDWLGNSCAASVIWGWYAVATSIEGNATFTMVPANGYLPVGGYKLNAAVQSYKEYNTEQIYKDNGVDAMAKALARVQPADALLSYMKDGDVTGHAQMAIEPAHVEYTDGKIDLRKSYIMVQDQHKGQVSKNEPFVTKLDGNRVHYAGHVSLKMTFEQLTAACYIPLTCAEFTGAKPYTAPSVEITGAEGFQELSDLKKITVSSPYTIAVIRARVLDGENQVAESRKLMGSRDLADKSAKAFSLDQLNMPTGMARNAKRGSDYRLVLEVTLATGSVYTLLDTIFTYNG